MESWAASRKGIHFPTLSRRLDLDTKMGETVISVSNTSESLSIRASSLEVEYFSFMDKMTGLVAMMKNTCKSRRMLESGSLLRFNFEWRVCANFQTFECF
jgi:hypothetical protein